MLLLQIHLKASEDRDILNWLSALPESQQETIIRDVLRNHARSHGHMPPVTMTNANANDPGLSAAAPSLVAMGSKEPTSDELDEKLAKIIDSF